MLMLQVTLRTLILACFSLLSTACSGDFVVETGLDTVAPTVPSSVSASGVSSSQVDVSWSASSDGVGVTGYYVYRDGTQVADVDGTSYSDTGLAASTTYGYEVAAYDAAGNTSSRSASVSATTQAAPGGDGFDAYAELPRAEVDFTMPTTSQTLTVKASGGDYTTLQDAWNSLSTRTANTEIVIDAGYDPGPLSTGAQSGDDSYWVVIRSANSGSLPPHVRVGPADKADMPQITIPSGAPGLDMRSGPTKRVRFVGISVEADGSSYNVGVQSDKNSEHIILDRCLVDGNYDGGGQISLGWTMRGSYVGLIDSYIHDVNRNGTESKAVLMDLGAGPVTIVNNFLESSGINILFGGTSMSDTSTLPHDITFVRNYLYKNPNWVSDANASVKNLFEIKVGVRFLIEHNAMENTWQDAQDTAVLLKSVNQGGNGSGYSQHITFRYNTVENYDSGINLAAQPNDWALYPMHHVSMHDNDFSVGGGTSNPYNQQSSPKAVALFDDIEYLNFKNNDFRGAFNNGVVNEGDGKTDLIFEDNIIGTNNYVFQNGGNLDTMAPGHSVDGNIFDDGQWNTLTGAGVGTNCFTWPPPDATCSNAGIQASRHASTKSGDFSADPWNG